MFKMSYFVQKIVIFSGLKFFCLNKEFQPLFSIFFFQSARLLPSPKPHSRLRIQFRRTAKGEKKKYRKVETRNLIIIPLDPISFSRIIKPRNSFLRISFLFSLSPTFSLSSLPRAAHFLKSSKPLEKFSGIMRRPKNFKKTKKMHDIHFSIFFFSWVPLISLNIILMRFNLFLKTS